MKKFFFVLFLYCSLVVANFALSQWSSDIRLTNATGSSFTPYNSARCMTTSGDTIHLVWWDYRDGNSEIYYKKSTNAGLNWGNDTRLTNDAGFSGYPCISAIGLNIHVVWFDNRNGFYNIFYKKSTNGGTNWGNDLPLTNDSLNNWDTFVLASGSTIHVVWEKYVSPSNMSMHYVRSTDNGNSWSADSRLTNVTQTALFPSLAATGSTIHLTWQDNRNAKDEIYYKCSTNNGVNWGADTRIVNNSGGSGNPLCGSFGSNLYLVWGDDRDGNDEIYFKQSSNQGVSWGNDIRLGDSLSNSGWPSVAISGSNIHITWEDQRDNNREIYYKRSTNNGISWGSDVRLTNNTASSRLPVIATTGSCVHIIWQDGRDGNDEIYYKRNPTGNITEVVRLKNELPDKYTLFQNYPNPFNPRTVIGYSLLKNSEVTLKVYDILGKEVATLVNEKQSPGMYEVTFDGTQFPSGIYFYTIETQRNKETKKMLLIK
jgi:hypothetical protein